MKVALVLLLVFGAIAALIYFGLIQFGGNNLFYPHIGPDLPS
jgi:hypothetical protein